MPKSIVRHVAYGEHGLTLVDRLGAWLSRRRVLRHLPRKTDLTALDCGCGFYAILLRDLKPRLSRGLGIDIHIDPAVRAMERLEFIESTLEESLPALPPDDFDLVLLISVLEHLTDPEETLNQCYRLLRPGGALLVNVPTWAGKRGLEFSAFKLRLSPAEEMNDHKMYYGKRDLWPLLVKSGFKPRHIKLNYCKFGLNLFGVCRKLGETQPAPDVPPERAKEVGKAKP